jgi:hypothetical protein
MEFPPTKCTCSRVELPVAQASNGWNGTSDEKHLKFWLGIFITEEYANVCNYNSETIWEGNHAPSSRNNRSITLAGNVAGNRLSHRSNR